MPLQIRRGTDAERLAMTQPLAQGELLFVSTPGAERLYIGNGSTLGGVQITGYTNADAKDAAAASFTGGTHSGITFTYNTVTDLISANVDLSNYQGTLRADAFKGSVFAEDSSLLVDAVAGVIPAAVVSGTFSGDVVGNTTGYHTGDVKGSIFADDSTLLVDAVSGTIVGPITGSVTGVVTGTAGSSLIGNVTGNITGVVTGTAGSSLIGDVTGYHTGDVKGSVFADDSTLLVDAVSGTISATSITGNIFTNLIDSANSSAITFTPAVIFNSDVTVDNELFANLIGNVTGNITGNVTGNVTGSILDSNGSAIIDGSNTTFNGSGINFNTTNATITSPGAVFTDMPFFIFTSVEPTGTLAPVSMFVQNNAGTNTAPFGLTRVRGSILTPTSVVNGDDLGQIANVGFDGTSFISSATITAVVDNVVSTGVIPSKMEFKTTSALGVLATKATIKSTVVEFDVPPRLPVVADDTARTALVPTPSTGMMIFMSSGTTPAATNKVQVYDSAAWVNLH